MKPKVLPSAAWGRAWALLALANAPRTLGGCQGRTGFRAAIRPLGFLQLAAWPPAVFSAAEQNMKQHAQRERGALVVWVCPSTRNPSPLRPSPDTTVHLRTKRSVDSSRHLRQRATRDQLGVWLRAAKLDHSGPQQRGPRCSHGVLRMHDTMADWRCRSLIGLLPTSLDTSSTHLVEVWLRSRPG